MKHKISSFLIMICFISVLCGCATVSSETDSVEFNKYDVSSVMPKIEYKIFAETEHITMYFPIVTNKEITKTELGGVAAKLPPTKADIKVTLRSMQQDNLNFPYQDKYISFLKYKLIIENKDLLQANDIINLFDTTLWIYHNLELQEIQFDENYLQITIVDKEREIVVPEWKNNISTMRTDIEFELNNKAN